MGLGPAAGKASLYQPLKLLSLKDFAPVLSKLFARN